MFDDTSLILSQSRWIPFALGTSWWSSDSPLCNPSFRKTQHHHSAHLLLLQGRRCFLTLTPSATSSATKVYIALAPSGITIARSSGISIARSKWHRNRSLQVASQSLAVLDFRRLHGSNPHEFSSLKLHLGMGEDFDFSVKQQSELQNKFGRRPSLFRLRRQSIWENDWAGAKLEAQRTSIRGYWQTGQNQMQRNDCLRATDHVRTGSVTQRSNNERLFNIGVAPPVSSTQWTGAAAQCREVSPD